MEAKCPYDILVEFNWTKGFISQKRELSINKVISGESEHMRGG
jgi:hypothetical protein